MRAEIIVSARFSCALLEQELGLGAARAMTLNADRFGTFNRERERTGPFGI